MTGLHRALVTATALGLAFGLVTAPPAHAAQKTVITFTVRGCDGCTIGVQRALKSGSPATPSRPAMWNGRKARVVDGRATLTVPTAYTAGMSFTISAPWEGETGAMSNIVLGDSPAGGDMVSKAAAKSRTKATACWAGTTSAKMTMAVSVTRTTVEGYGGPAVAALAWASPTVPTLGALSKTFKGTLGNQEAFFC